MIVQFVSGVKDIWYKLSETAKATILGNSKTPHKTSTYVNFRDVALDDLIKAIFHQFDFGDTPNGPIINDLIEKYHHTDSGGDTSMILINLSKRIMVYLEDIMKVLYIPNLILYTVYGRSQY